MSDCFGPLLQAHAETMSRVLEASKAKSQRTENGKGRGHQPPHSTPASRRGRPRRQGQDLDLQQPVKALGRLVIQQETSIKVLRQDTSWVIFVQPGPQSSLQLLFKVGQAWKDNQQKGAVNRPIRCVLITCLMEHLLKILEDLKGPLLEKPQTMMGALVVNQDRAPVPPQQVIQELKEIIPLLSTPYMTHRFHANRAMKEASDKVSAFQLEVSGRTEGPHKVWHTLWKHSPIARCFSRKDSTSTRFAPAFPGGRARAEIDQQLVRLRLLNSSSTCYINVTVFAWLHMSQCLACSDRQAYGSKTQPWRDIAQSDRPIHVHTLTSWRSILAGWRDLHHQQDASEFLEHWVAVGRPQTVIGTWEARVENQHLIEIRHYSSTEVALNLDLDQTCDPQNLQHLILIWHTQQLGIQALKDPPLVLMIRLSRFQRLQHRTHKVRTPVIIEPRVNIPVFDDEALQCTNVPYDVLSVILHAGNSPSAGHYTTRLLTPAAGGTSVVQWSTDDARPATIIMRDTMQDHNLSHQSYILLFGRGTSAHAQ